MTMSLAAACSAIMNLSSMDQRREAIEKLPQRARDFMSSRNRTTEDLIGTKGMPFTTFKALVQIYIDHRDTAPETTSNLMASLTDVISDSIETFGSRSPFIGFAKNTAFVNKLLALPETNIPVALKLIEACVPNDPDFLSANQKKAAYMVINQRAPQFLPDHYRKPSIVDFLPQSIVNQARIIDILHQTEQDPLYLAKLCLERDADKPLAKVLKPSKHYQLKAHFTSADQRFVAQWDDGPPSCIGVSGVDLGERTFFLIQNGVLVTEDADPVRISEKEGRSLIAERQLRSRILQAQKLMRSPKPGS